MKKSLIKNFIGHESYTVQEIIEKCEVSERTVLRWIKCGLAPVDSKSKPYLFLGSSLKNFLKKPKRKRFTLPTTQHFPCWRCNAPTLSRRKDISSDGSIRRGICKKCGSNVCRTIGKRGVKIRSP